MFKGYKTINTEQKRKTKRGLKKSSINQYNRLVNHNEKGNSNISVGKSNKYVTYKNISSTKRKEAQSSDFILKEQTIESNSNSQTNNPYIRNNKQYSKYTAIKASKTCNNNNASNIEESTKIKRQSALKDFFRLNNMLKQTKSSIKDSKQLNLLEIVDNIKKINHTTKNKPFKKKKYVQELLISNSQVKVMDCKLKEELSNLKPSFNINKKKFSFLSIESDEDSQCKNNASQKQTISSVNNKNQLVDLFSYENKNKLINIFNSFSQYKNKKKASRYTDYVKETKILAGLKINCD